LTANDKDHLYDLLHCPTMKDLIWQSSAATLHVQPVCTMSQ